MFIYPLNYQKLLRKGDRHILEINKHKMYLICIKEFYCGLNHTVLKMEVSRIAPAHSPAATPSILQPHSILKT